MNGRKPLFSMVSTGLAADAVKNSLFITEPKKRPPRLIAKARFQTAQLGGEASLPNEE